MLALWGRENKNFFYDLELYVTKKYFPSFTESET